MHLVFMFFSKLKKKKAKECFEEAKNKKLHDFEEQEKIRKFDEAINLMKKDPVFSAFNKKVERALEKGSKVSKEKQFELFAERFELIYRIMQRKVSSEYYVNLAEQLYKEGFLSKKDYERFCKEFKEMHS